MIVDHFTLRGVYYLESQNLHMNPIAIRPEIRKGYISWEDTGHGRVIQYSQLFFDEKEIEPPFSEPEKLPERIKVISQTNETFKLIKLTARIFKEKLKDGVACGQQLNFKTDEDVQKYYLKANFDTF